MPGLDGLRLHLADEVLPLWHAVQVETGDPDTPLPYWAFAWSGGLAIGRYLRDHPEAVAGRRVLDLASGSGLCAIEAAARRRGVGRRRRHRPVRGRRDRPQRAGRSGSGSRSSRRDLLDDPLPPDIDVILAGDCWYEAAPGRRVLPWLRRAQRRGIDVLTGDPDRRYLPTDDLVELARYDVRTTTELEDLERKSAAVYALRSIDPEPEAG